MISKLDSGVCYAYIYMRGGAAWGMLTGKGRWYSLQVILCDPYLSALEVLAKTRYTNRRYLYLYLYRHKFYCWNITKSSLSVCKEYRSGIQLNMDYTRLLSLVECWVFVKIKQKILLETNWSEEKQPIPTIRRLSLNWNCKLDTLKTRSYSTNLLRICSELFVIDQLIHLCKNYNKELR